MDKRNESKLLPQIEQRGRNWGRGFIKRIKQAWDNMYKNSTMTALTLRDNTARFPKDKSLLNLTKVRHGNDVDSEIAQKRAINPARIQENV